MNVIDLISSMEDVVLEGQIPLFKSKSIINIDEFLKNLISLFLICKIPPIIAIAPQIIVSNFTF